MTSYNPNPPNHPQWSGQQPPPPPGYQPPNPYAQSAQPAKKGRRVGVVVAVVAVAVVVVVAAVVIGSMFAFSGGGGVTAVASPAPAAAPQTPVAVTNDTIQVGRADAPVVVGVYFDYMCPFCGQFERPNSAELQQDVQAGTIRLDLHPMSFLDQASTTQYSTRAANAAVTVAKQAPDALLAFHAALFEHQPAEGTVGLSDDELVQLATQAGVPASVTDTFASQSNTTWVTAATQAAFSAGVTGTPTVTINGQKFAGDLYKAGALTAAITQAAPR